MCPDSTFDGETFEPELDEERLTTLLGAVFDLMRDGQWRTLRAIRQVLGRGTEASISARLRDFRKERHGGHTILRRRVGEPGEGLFEYRLVLAAPPVPEPPPSPAPEPRPGFEGDHQLRLFGG